MLLLLPIILISIISVKLSNFIIIRNKAKRNYNRYISYIDNCYHNDGSKRVNPFACYSNRTYEYAIRMLVDIKSYGNPSILKPVEIKTLDILWEVALSNANKLDLSIEKSDEYESYLRNTSLK